MIIYKITNIQNNKVYIGQTNESIKKRFSRHMGYQALEHDTKFYRAVRKYGRENFIIEQIDVADNQEELDTKEVYWIRFYDSVNNGYNSNDYKGKVGGDTLTNHPDIKAIGLKISESKLGGKNPNARKVKAINIKTNEILTFNSYAECKKYLGFSNHAMISSRCLGKVKTPYQKTWLFEYID